MGYDFARNASKKDAVDHVLRTHQATVHGYGRTDRGTVNSRHLWFVDVDGLIHLALLKSDRGSWGSKVMDVNTGPTYYTCPQSVLDAATAPLGEYGAQWLKLMKLPPSERTEALAQAWPKSLDQ